jgi:hypothetical protein
MKKMYLIGLVALGCAGAVHAQQSTIQLAQETVRSVPSTAPELAKPQGGNDLIVIDKGWSASLKDYARKNGFTILVSPGDRQIRQLPSAMAYGGPEFEGACTQYQMGFVTDASGKRVWTVLVDAEGRKVDLLLGRDGEVYLAGPAGIEPMGKPRHGRWKTPRRDRKECRRVPRF